ncbi:hypothetical protein Emed_001634 [Eimeria media]
MGAPRGPPGGPPYPRGPPGGPQGAPRGPPTTEAPLKEADKELWQSDDVLTAAPNTAREGGPPSWGVPLKRIQAGSCR